MGMGYLPVSANGIVSSVGTGIIGWCGIRFMPGFLGKRGIMKMKYGLMIIVLGILLGQAGHEAVGEGLPELKDKHITIHPKMPAKDGINSGLVILFGHPVPPPYKIEYRGEKIFVNDVQASPSPLWEEKVGKPIEARLEHDKKMKEDMEKNPKKYLPRETLIEWLQAQCPFDSKTDKEIKEITQHMLIQKDWVKELRWNHRHSHVIVVWNRGPKEFAVVCKKPRKFSWPESMHVLSPEEQKKNAVVAKAQKIKNFGYRLKADGCIYFSLSSYDYCQVTPDLISMMRDETIASNKRKEQLDLLLRPEWAEELITNYVPEEWKALPLNK
ncbi:MAG: hypothetical protein GX410_08820 [Elusimicrobia bacterium]|nr:hypothetical protein [Elusimicrobiota bacterium]